MQRQLVSELQKLQELHASGFLTDTELAQAKNKLLGSTSASPDSLTVEEADAMLVRVDRAEQKAQLAELRGELTRMDQDWQESRKQYLLKGNQGIFIEPTRGSAIGQGILLALVGLLAMAVSSLAGSSPRVGSGLSLLIGFLGFALAVAGIVSAQDHWGKAEAWERAQADHGQRREQLLEKIQAFERRK